MLSYCFHCIVLLIDLWCIEKTLVFQGVRKGCANLHRTCMHYTLIVHPCTPHVITLAHPICIALCIAPRSCLHMPSHAFTCLHMPSHAFTCLHMPSHAFTCLHMPSHAFTDHAFTCLHMPSHAFTDHAFTLHRSCLHMSSPIMPSPIMPSHAFIMPSPIMPSHVTDSPIMPSHVFTDHAFTDHAFMSCLHIMPSDHVFTDHAMSSPIMSSPIMPSHVFTDHAHLHSIVQHTPAKPCASPSLTFSIAFYIFSIVFRFAVLTSCKPKSLPIGHDTNNTDTHTRNHKHGTQRFYLCPKLWIA
jgi:hypothetical protein